MNKRLKTLIQRRIFKYDDEHPSGVSGYYMSVGWGIGVKIYFSSKKYRTPKQARNSREWWEAAHALHLLKKAEKFDVTPKGYGVAVVRCGKREYAVALVMQHIKGTQRFGDSYKKISKAVSKLKRGGIYAHDAGSHNAIKDEKGKVYLIDTDCWHYKGMKGRTNKRISFGGSYY